MGRNPAFQFYPNDWNRDLEEHPLEIQGAWIVILCKLWWSDTRGELTKTLEEWSRILREKNKKTEKILRFLGEKNIANVSFLDNQKITIISRRMVKDYKISKLRRRVGKLGGNPGLKKISENRKILDNQTDKQKDQSPSPSPSPSPNPKNNIEYPDFLDLELWKEFKKMRVKIKKPLTDYAEQLALKKIESLRKSGNDPSEVLRRSIENCWQGLFPIDGQSQNPDRPEYRNRTTKAELDDLYANSGNS